jgi:DNA-binding CsgD family transcriptional regulator
VEQTQIELALDACYDAILAPETWPQALHALARALDAAAMIFYPANPDESSSDPLDPNRPLQQSPMSSEYLPLIDEYVRDQWYLGHYRAERGRPLLQAGRSVVLEHDLASDEERKTLRVYNELYLRWGYPGFAMTGFRVDGQVWAVPILRAEAQGHFTREEAPRLAALNPHLARMIRLSERFALGQASAQMAMLDRLGCAAVLLDRSGHVRGMNRQADALMGEGIAVCRGVLRAADAPSDRDLRRLLEWAGSGPLSRSAPPPRHVVVQRAGRRALVVEALPVAGLAADCFGQACVLLAITDLEARSPLPEALLRSAFGLTAAEARLAARLGAGERLEDAAGALGITKNTARVQLRAVFAKTGTSRQPELVALLARLGASGDLHAAGTSGGRP